MQSVRRQSFSQQEAATFFRQARRVLRHPAFDILIAPSVHTTPKLLVVTPARIGNAPERNKVRRRIKAFFYEKQPLNVQYDCAIIVKQSGTALSFAELTALIQAALEPYAVPV